jgi:chromosome segregation ATPase
MQTVANEEMEEIRETTSCLSKDMKIMKKFVEDLQMSINEKEAEIIKLNMHLGDEKKKYINLYRK